MEANELLIAKNYFEKAKKKRVGQYMSELRRQFIIRMQKNGARSRHIQAVTFLRHDQVWHYINRYKPNQNIEKQVSEMMDEWMEKSLYPISAYNHTGELYYILLTADKLGMDNSNYYRKTPRTTRWDNLVSNL